MGVNFLVAGAEDRAPQGCDLSADPGAEIGRERASLAPLLQAHLGTKAINPGGLGAKPPALPASPSFIGFHKTFDTTGNLQIAKLSFSLSALAFSLALLDVFLRLQLGFLHLRRYFHFGSQPPHSIHPS